MILRKNEIKHYSGLESDLISTLPSGDTFFSTDTNKLYKYNEDKLPYLIGSESVEGLYLPIEGGALTGDVTSSGTITASGILLTGDQDLSTYALLTDITGTNSGTNTGDQDLSGLLLNTTDTFTGTLTLTGKLVLGDALNNSFIGLSSGFSNTTGGLNVGLGYFSLFGNTTGASNVAIGNSSGRFIADGATENETGSSSIFIGKSTRANADAETNQIVIGDSAIGAGSNTVTLGNDSIVDTYLKGVVSITDRLDLGDALNNTFIGTNSGGQNTTGDSNVSVGLGALQFNTTGIFNTAIGKEALNKNIGGNWNTANGYYALYKNTEGEYNTANGNEAMYENTTGGDNIAIGSYAVYNNKTSSNNTAIGSYALYNTTSGNNTSTGYQSLYANIGGIYNTTSGAYALDSNTSGSYNTASGSATLGRNSTGSNNVASGYQSGRFLANKTTSATILNDSVMLGWRTSPLANNETNQIVIGYDATGNGSNTVTLGNDSITDTYLKGDVTITGNVLGEGVTRYIDTELTSAQILNLHITPVYTLPQPTNGEIYAVDRVVLKYSFGTISYAPSSMQIKYAYYTDSVKADEATNTIFASEAIPQFTRLGLDGNPIPTSQSGIALHTDTPITLGDGTMKVRTYYRVIESTF